MNNFTDDFVAEINTELSFRYADISRYLFRISSMSGVLTPVAHIVSSLAWQTRLTGSVGISMSAM